MTASDFLKLVASKPEKANEHIARLLGWGRGGSGAVARSTGPKPQDFETWNILDFPPYATGASGDMFFEMWDALPRHLTESWFLHEARGLNEARGYRVGHTKRGAGGLSHYAPTRNLAVAAALSETCTVE